MNTLESPRLPQLTWLQALHDPAMALHWRLAEWERVVRISRRLRLLARLSASLEGAGLLEQVPAPARRHLIAEQRLSHWRTSAMVWALDRIVATLGEQPYPLVLLKGAAYVGQGLSISAGRMPSDVDIMIPRAHLLDAQTRLMHAGWRELQLQEHDRRYYHEWSHEVPPMRHPIHRVELDLHHNILPPVARTHVDAEALISRLQPSKWPSWQVLAPTDQVLHSAAHLFLDSELRDRIRDLVDLDGLLRHFGAAPSFYVQLLERARELGLEEPLALASHFCVSWLRTPIPHEIQATIVAMGPGRVRRAWLVLLLEAVLTPTEPDGSPPLRQDLAAFVVLARYHRQRMPMRLLVPHLWHKLRALRIAETDGVAKPAQG
jgi:hypothetical protein